MQGKQIIRSEEKVPARSNKIVLIATLDCRVCKGRDCNNYVKKLVQCMVANEREKPRWSVY